MLVNRTRGVRLHDCESNKGGYAFMLVNRTRGVRLHACESNKGGTPS